MPAVSNATGAQIPLPKGLTVFDPSKDALVNEMEFGFVNEFSSGVEGAVSTAVGQLVRGAGPLSLNNEALASLIETAVGVTVRKAMEKVTWCLFACDIANIPKENNTPQAREAQAVAKHSVLAGADRVKVFIRISGSAPSAISTN